MKEPVVFAFSMKNKKSASHFLAGHTQDYHRLLYHCWKHPKTCSSDLKGKEDLASALFVTNRQRSILVSMKQCAQSELEARLKQARREYTDNQEDGQEYEQRARAQGRPGVDEHQLMVRQDHTRLGVRLASLEQSLKDFNRSWRMLEKTDWQSLTLSFPYQEVKSFYAWLNPDHSRYGLQADEKGFLLCYPDPISREAKTILLQLLDPDRAGELEALLEAKASLVLADLCRTRERLMLELAFEIPEEQG